MRLEGDGGSEKNELFLDRSAQSLLITESRTCQIKLKYYKTIIFESNHWP